MGIVIDINIDLAKKEEADGYLQKADKAFDSENFKKAEFLYEVARTCYSDRVRPPASLYERLSDCRLYMKYFDDAVRTLEECLDQYPDDIDVLVKLGTLHIDQWKEIQDPEAAVKYFSRVKELKPDYRSSGMSIHAMLAYAISYSRQGNHR